VTEEAAALRQRSRAKNYPQRQKQVGVVIKHVEKRDV